MFTAEDSNCFSFQAQRSGEDTLSIAPLGVVVLNHPVSLNCRLFIMFPTNSVLYNRVLIMVPGSTLNMQLPF